MLENTSLGQSTGSIAEKTLFSLIKLKIRSMREQVLTFPLTLRYSREPLMRPVFSTSRHVSRLKS